jgi:hypothetical protein
MSKPWGKVSRRTYWRGQVRRAKTPEERLERSFNFLRAMSAAAKTTRPGSAKDALDRAAKTLEAEAEALADRVPADRLERGGARR